MFSLYGDLPAPKSKNDSSESSETTTPSTSTPPSTKPAGWSNMQQFRRPMMRKPTIQAKPVIPAGATIVSTTTVTKDPSPSPQPVASTPPKPSSSPVLRPLQTKSYQPTNDYGSRKKKKAAVQNQGPPPIDLYEDYDPLKPTDYEQYKEEMEILRRQRQSDDDFDDDDDDNDDDDDYDRSLSPRHRGFAPPPDLYTTSKSPPPPPAPSFVQESGDEAYQRRAMMSRPTHDPPPPPTSTAWKMMNKYGWQQGQGLGRTQDGIREALQVQARGDGSGVVLAPSRPSSVVVLKNMVGQVDDQLEQETAEECGKYGRVEQCVIYPLDDGSDVWIFIKFAHPNAAQAAVADLNGRYFDGRVVVAEEYDQGRFDRLDLAP